MTIQNTTIRKAGPSQGNGVNVSFPFTFKVFASADVLVTYLDAIGTESSLVLSTDYTVALNADQNIAPGGTVTLLWTPAMDTYITLTSQVSYTQNLALTNAGGFYPTSINDALDRIVIQVQQLAEFVSRCAKAPLSGIGSLPASSLVFGVDSSGIPVLSQLASISSTAVSTFMNTLLGLSSASAVKTALSVQSDLQTQANTQVTTTGTSTAYIAAPSPINATPTANTRLRVKFHLASGVTPTLTVGSVTAALQQYAPTGTLVAATPGAGQLTDVEYNGTVYVVLDPLTPVITPPNQIQPFTATTTTNALTGVYAASTLAYRSATATLGTPITLANSSLSLTVPATSNLGMVLTAQTNRLIWLVAYNAGTPVLCVVNLAGGNSLDETGFISPTTIGAASNTANVIYSASSVSAGSPYRVVGYTDVIFTTGTGWSSPTLVQGQGGQALSAMSSLGYGQTFQSVTRVSGTTYYNTTGKPIMAVIDFNKTNAQTLNIGGTAMPMVGNAVLCELSFIVPPSMSYSFTAPTGISAWFELR